MVQDNKIEDTNQAGREAIGNADYNSNIIKHEIVGKRNMKTTRRIDDIFSSLKHIPIPMAA